MLVRGKEINTPVKKASLQQRTPAHTKKRKCNFRIICIAWNAEIQGLSAFQLNILNNDTDITLYGIDARTHTLSLGHLENTSKLHGPSLKHYSRC
jgi:hypothetical protein